MTGFIVVHIKCAGWKERRKGGGSQRKRTGGIAGGRRVEKRMKEHVLI